MTDKTISGAEAAALYTRELEKNVREKSDPLAQPIENIVDGWSLKNGNICLHVKCGDGVTREIEIVPRRVTTKRR